jgi:hypothetical protein
MTDEGLDAKGFTASIVVVECAWLRSDAFVDRRAIA